jgi:HD-GYP domain-containing protein (c-di-GMP phosphodiesterase class II)
MVGDLRRAMERVAGSEERLRGIVTSNPDPVLVVDAEGVIRFANLAAVVLVGAGETDLTGKPFGLTCQTGVRTEVELPGPGGAPISLELWAVETEWDERPAQLVAARDVSERRHAQHRLWRAHLDTIQRLILASELKDRDTAAHVQRIGETCAILGRALGLPGPQAELLRQASQMHDVGKIGVPDSILLKPGPLTPGERQVMEEHTFIGARLLHGSPSHLLHTGEVIALSHHERWDGRGYPLGLAGDDIPLFGRICAVADFFDALTSDRPYRGARPVEETLALMEEQRGGHFDPGLLDLFRLHLDAVLEVRRVFDTAPPHGTLSDLLETAPIVGLEAAGCPCADGTPFGLDAVPPGTLPSR